MKKIKLGTSDGATENAKRITELFPQVVTEIKAPTVKSNVLLTLTPYETFLVMWSKVSVSVISSLGLVSVKLKQRRVAPSIRR